MQGPAAQGCHRHRSPVLGANIRGCRSLSFECCSVKWHERRRVREWSVLASGDLTSAKGAAKVRRGQAKHRQRCTAEGGAAALQRKKDLRTWARRQPWANGGSGCRADQATRTGRKGAVELQQAERGGNSATGRVHFLSKTGVGEGAGGWWGSGGQGLRGTHLGGWQARRQGGMGRRRALAAARAVSGPRQRPGRGGSGADQRGGAPAAKEYWWASHAWRVGRAGGVARGLGQKAPRAFSLPVLALAAGKDGIDHQADQLAGSGGEEEGLGPGAGLVKKVSRSSHAQHARQRARGVAQPCGWGAVQVSTALCT